MRKTVIGSCFFIISFIVYIAVSSILWNVMWPVMRANMFLCSLFVCVWVCVCMCCSVNSRLELSLWRNRPQKKKTNKRKSCTGDRVLKIRSKLRNYHQNVDNNNNNNGDDDNGDECSAVCLCVSLARFWIEIYLCVCDHFAISMHMPHRVAMLIFWHRTRKGVVAHGCWFGVCISVYIHCIFCI